MKAFSNNFKLFAHWNVYFCIIRNPLNVDIILFSQNTWNNIDLWFLIIFVAKLILILITIKNDNIFNLTSFHSYHSNPANLTNHNFISQNEDETWNDWKRLKIFNQNNNNKNKTESIEGEAYRMLIKRKYFICFKLEFYFSYYFYLLERPWNFCHSQLHARLFCFNFKIVYFSHMHFIALFNISFLYSSYKKIACWTIFLCMFSCLTNVY